jgi:predicted transcriptional regulator
MLPIHCENLDLELAILRTPLIISPENSVLEAIAKMSGVRASCSSSKEENSYLDALQIEACSSCVLVVKNDRLVGIFTERDVVRLSAEKQPVENIQISEVMTQPVITLRKSEFTNFKLTVGNRRSGTSRTACHSIDPWVISLIAQSRNYRKCSD